MKKLFLLLTFFGLLATACESGGSVEEENGGNAPTLKIELSKQTVDVDFEGKECELTVNAECSWAATCSANWITIQTPEGIAGKEPLRFNVARNTESSERKTTITLKNDNYNLIQEIYVIQSAFTPGTKSDCVIYYTSSYGNIVEPYKPDGFGANIISNKYEDGQGTLLFDAPITSIGQDAFYGCTSLTSITIPDSVTSIGDLAFSGCGWLTSVTIGNGVTRIGKEAFRGCDSLKRVTIPNSVTSIGSNAFRGCTSLTSVTIPNSVTSIGYYAFMDCTSLTSVTIPDSVTSIVDGAFWDCTSLTSATIPDSVTSIGECAFYECYSLTSVTIPNSVTSIGSSAFRGCYSLTSVTIPNSVTSIGSSAFSYCTSLRYVTIGNGVTSIGEDAFYWCTSLTSVYCKPTTPPAGGLYMFDYNAYGRRICVPRASVYAYKLASYWNNYSSDIVGYDF